MIYNTLYIYAGPRMSTFAAVSWTLLWAIMYSETDMYIPTNNPITLAI